MANILLIESRDGFEARDGGFGCVLAQTLAGHGNAVTVFMVQNGVLSARAGAQAPQLAALRDAGVELLADSFSLRERGIGLTSGVTPSELDIVIDRMAEGWQVIFH
jgi:hypothetical protein